MTAVRLVLASSSPRRAELLRAAGYSFDTVVVDIDESVRAGEDAAAYVRRLAMEKSARAQEVVAGAARPTPQAGRPRAAEDCVVIGADTAVVVDGAILGKPSSADDGVRMLRLISGRRHLVLTGVSLRRNEVEAGGVESTSVEFVRLGEDDLRWYLASGEGADKAGGYAIQGLASRFISRIEGSYSNVVGLPVARVHHLIGCLASAQ
jgi:septum formation protein